MNALKDELERWMQPALPAAVYAQIRGHPATVSSKACRQSHSPSRNVGRLLLSRLVSNGCRIRKIYRKS